MKRRSFRIAAILRNRHHRPPSVARLESPVRKVLGSSCASFPCPLATRQTHRCLTSRRIAGAHHPVADDPRNPTIASVAYNPRQLANSGVDIQPHNLQESARDSLPDFGAAQPATNRRNADDLRLTDDDL